MVLLQSFEHFGVISLVDESPHHRKLLWICFFTIILTVLMPNSIDVSQKIAHKERGKQQIAWPPCHCHGRYSLIEQ